MNDLILGQDIGLASGSGVDINQTTQYVFPSNNYPDKLELDSGTYLKTGVVATDIDNYPKANVGTAVSVALHKGTVPTKPPTMPTRAENNKGRPVANRYLPSSPGFSLSTVSGGIMQACAWESNRLYIVDHDSRIYIYDISSLSQGYSRGITYGPSSEYNSTFNAGSLRCFYLSGSTPIQIHYYGGVWRYITYANAAQVMSNTLIQHGAVQNGFVVEGRTYYSMSNGKLYKCDNISGAGAKEVQVDNGDLINNAFFDGNRVWSSANRAYRFTDYSSLEHDPYVPAIPPTSGIKKAFTGSHWISVSGSQNCSVTVHGHSEPSYVHSCGTFNWKQSDALLPLSPHEGNAHNDDEIVTSFSGNTKSIDYDGINYWQLVSSKVNRFDSSGADGIVYRDDQHIVPEATSGYPSYDSNGFMSRNITYPLKWVPTIQHQHSIDLSAQLTAPRDIYSDGSSLWALDSDSKLYRYADINSVPTYSGDVVDLSSIDNDIKAMANDGSNWFILGGEHKAIFKLSSVFDTPVELLKLPSSVIDPVGLAVSDKTGLLVPCSATDTIHQFAKDSGLHIGTLAMSKDIVSVTTKGDDLWVASPSKLERFTVGLPFVGTPIATTTNGLPDYLKVKD